MAFDTHFPAIGVFSIILYLSAASCLYTMRTITVAFFFGVFSLFLFSCQPEIQKTESGLEYKIFRNGSGVEAKSGSTVKLHYSQVLHDTVTSTTRGKMPYYKALIPGTIFAYDPFEVLIQGVREGDSIVVIQRMDSLLKKGRLSQLPPHLKPEDALEVRIKVLKVFPFELMRPNYSDSLVHADKAAERALLDSIHTIQGPKRVEAYLAKQNIQAARNSHGTWVQLIEPGNGMVADSGKWVQAKFTLQTLQGKVLDSNIDTSFRKDGPLKFQVGSGYLPASVDRSIRALQQGTHAKIYIPAMIALNDLTGPTEQPSYDDMIFEIILEEVRE